MVGVRRGGPSAVLLLLLPLLSAAAGAADLPKDMDALVEEGKRWFRASGDTALPMAERNAARVKAWKCLWPAREALDAFGESNPAEMERADAKYGDVRMMVHWLKKESPVGLLESTGVGPWKGGGASPAPPPGAPPPPAPGPAPGPAPPAPPPRAPAPAPAPPPAAQGADSPASLLAEAEAYERRHRFDVPGIQERYQRVVEAFPDLSREEVRKAVEKAGALEARLKDGYRVLRDEDPDALQGIDSVRVKGMVWAVGRDLGSSDPALRERAARTLGLLSHPEGVSLLRGALKKEADGAVADAMADALLRIGGSKGATALADFHADPRHDGRCLEALVRLAGRNPVDRRIAAVQMGRYAGARDEGCFRRMVEVLRGLGYDGAIGLASSLDNNSTHARIVHVIGVLADTKLPRVARVVSRYFQASRVPADGQVREAALQAVRKLAKPENAGEAVVPQLFHALRFEATRWQTTELLRELTGQEFTVKQWGRWSAWWKSRHPDWKEDGGAR